MWYAVCGNQCKKCDKWNKECTAFKYDPCAGCGNREVIFHGQNTVKEFCTWLFSEQHTNIIVIAHNARAYNAYFIYNYLLTQSITPDIIFRGSKIMYCKVGRGLNIKILDSLNFLNMPLDKLPKSFGLKEMKKGYFPYLYNTQEMNNLKGSKFLLHLPPLHFYDVDNMNIEKHEQFLIWYKNNKHKCFDFYKELLGYFQSNVNILLNACSKLRQLYMESTGLDNPIDPFNYITIASLCMGTFRAKFLPKKWKILTKSKAREGCLHNNWDCLCEWDEGCNLYGDGPIEMLHSNGMWAVPVDDLICRFINSPKALLPIHGYMRRDNYSQQAMQWILNEESKMQQVDKNLKIRHAESFLGEKCITYRDEFGRL